MEIDRAVRECSDRRLQTKYANATYVIQRAFALYSFDEVAFSFNGGKDSTVLLHLLRAGFFLHERDLQDGRQSGYKEDCPLRTIYFESPSAFPEINSFTYEMASNYDLQLEIIRSDFKSGLEELMKKKPTKAIFLGTRIGDPNAVGQEQFSPSSTGWPPFMRVNPILDWSYRDVWAFILTCKVKYCSLYDQGYTSIGSIYDTVPNALLSVTDSSSKKEHFKPAYLLSDGRLERAGRSKKFSSTSSALNNGVSTMNSCHGSLVASIIAVADEMLFGTYEDHIALNLSKKLHGIGWQVTRSTVVRNDVDAVAEEVEQRKSSSDLVFLFGGVGPLHSDVSVAGVAKAYGVRLAPDEEFEEYLRHLIGEQCTGDRNEMALLPEGITELLHHDLLPIPLIKCGNVIILTSSNVNELHREWDCLLDLPETPLVRLAPFTSKHLSTCLSDVEISKTLSKFCLDYPDLYIGCHRISLDGPLIISFVGKEKERIDLAVQDLSRKFQPAAFCEVGSE